MYRIVIKQFRAVVVSLVAFLSMAVQGLGAQEAESQPMGGNPPSSSELRERLDSLTLAWNEARARRGLNGFSQSWAQELVGPFRVFAAPDELSELADAVSEAWSRHESAWEGWEEAGVSLRRDLVFPIEAGGPGPDGVNADAVVVVPTTWAATATDRVRKAMESHLTSLTAPEVMQWAAGIPSLVPANRPRARRDVVAAGFSSAFACWNQEWESCERAFGISGEAWDAAFTDEELFSSRNRVFGWDLTGAIPKWERTAARCLETGVRTPCLEAWGGTRDVAIPIGPFARHHLMMVALELGGEGAATRLNAQKELSLSSRLQAASQVELEVLFKASRADLLYAETNATAPQSGEGAAVAGWLLLMGFLSSRSTRWRA